MIYTGKIAIRATALEPIVHGAGTSGNEQLVRKTQWITDDGEIVMVPMVSGNGIKHKIRECGAQYAIDALGIEDRSLSKHEVDLLFSGGHLSKSGSAIDLQQARDLQELFPILSLCGYSAGNTMTESKISVGFLHVVCVENANRLPDDLAAHPARMLRAGALLVEEFGTRHDMANRAIGQRLLTADAAEAQVRKKTKQLKSGDASDTDRGESAQMIYNFGAISAGATLWGDILVAQLTDLERAALSSALHYAAFDRVGDHAVMAIGAKNSIGFGRIKVEIRGALRTDLPIYTDDKSLTVLGDDLASRYQAHLRDNRAEILKAIHRAVS